MTKEYYEKHKDELLKKIKAYRLNHLKQERESHRNYYLKHKAEILLKCKKYREEHKEQVKNGIKKWKALHPERVRELGRIHSGKSERKLRQKVLEVIGSKCIICGLEKRLTLHEIHGKPHKIKGGKYYIEHPKDFIPTCYKHHGTIHDLANLNDEQINNILIFSRMITEKEE